MPEEINRTLIDKIANLHFTPSQDANENLFKEGISSSVHLVGNIMIDSYFYAKKQIEASGILEKLDLSEKSFALATIHRQSNVDKRETLLELMDELHNVAKLRFLFHKFLFMFLILLNLS